MCGINAVIMAAGASSRFAPLSYERPKGLITVRGEVLIERQIKQLIEAGISDIFVVTGYKAGAFEYLGDKFGVKLIENREYKERNNNSSIMAAEAVIGDTYVCSADNYFSKNPFLEKPGTAFYSAVYSHGPTDEWCIDTDENGYITGVTVGGENAWYMLGHTFWDRKFSRAFISILNNEYDKPETADKLWETIFLEHLDQLHMKIRKYPDHSIFEFDTLDELRLFDKSYIKDTHSEILKKLAVELDCSEEKMNNFRCIKDGDAEAIGFSFRCGTEMYRFFYKNGNLEKVGETAAN